MQLHSAAVWLILAERGDCESLNGMEIIYKSPNFIERLVPSLACLGWVD